MGEGVCAIQSMANPKSEHGQLDAIGLDAICLDAMFGFEKSMFDEIAVSASIVLDLLPE